MRTVILFFTLIFSGCDILLDEAFDCIDNDKPEFDIKSLPIAYLNEVYSQEIKVSIVRESNDSWYQYDFDISGDLPVGLELRTDQFSRVAEIYGVPVELGEYSFNLRVMVTEPEGYEETDENYDDGDDLCRSQADRNYVINVVVPD